MKKAFKFVLTLFVLSLMVFAISFSCFADTYVTYAGNSSDFVFSTKSDKNPTDIFENFKDAMPGDVLTQDIVIKNSADKQVDVEIFLKSLGADDESKDFLSKLKLDVKVIDGDTIESGYAAESGKLTDFVSLGKFASGSTSTLRVTLEVPKDLSNDYAEKSGMVKWQFKVEEKPVEVPVQTSDNSKLILLCSVLAAGVSAMTALIVLKRKNNI